MATDATGAPTPLGIPTYNINVDAPSGNGNTAQMIAIDTLIAARATLASPTFTGTPLAPTPATADNTTKIATTAFVKAQGYLTANAVSSVFGRTGAVVATAGDYVVADVTGAAPLASPSFTGVPAAPTPATADNTTKIATTAFVKAQGYLTANAVTSVFGRGGAVVAASGDYTAAQVTNAADKASASAQAFTGTLVASGFVTNIVSNSNATSFNLTPDLATGNYAVGTCTAGGANSSINNPTNPPSGSESAILTVELRNTGGSSTNLTWGTAYVGSNFVLPAVLAGGARAVLIFSWSPLDSKWRAVGTF